MEAWEKVFVSSEDFIGSIHGSLGCIACHGGTGGSGDMETAHEGVVSDPAAEDACASCHPDVTEGHVNSLHGDLAGYMRVLETRGSEETMDDLMVAYDNHCAGCHASCGQCHVSRPTSTGGGLLSGHDFRGVPLDRPGADGGLGGLVKFKAGFAAQYVEYVGEWDLPLSALLYRAFTLLEPSIRKIRLKLRPA